MATIDQLMYEYASGENRLLSTINIKEVLKVLLIDVCSTYTELLDIIKAVRLFRLYLVDPIFFSSIVRKSGHTPSTQTGLLFI